MKNWEKCWPNITHQHLMSGITFLVYSSVLHGSDLLWGFNSFWLTVDGEMEWNRTNSSPRSDSNHHLLPIAKESKRRLLSLHMIMLELQKGRPDLLTGRTILPTWRAEAFSFYQSAQLHNLTRIKECDYMYWLINWMKELFTSNKSKLLLSLDKT